MSDEKNLLDFFANEEEKMTEKQRKIIEAAVEMFAEKGYAATSTSQIAKKAGVAEGTIFRHYKTKKDLLIGIVSPMIAKVIAPFVVKDIQKIMDTPYERYEDFLRAVIVNRQEFLLANMNIFRIVVQEIPFHPELKEQFKEHVIKKVNQRFAVLVKHYQQQGQIIEMPTNTAIRFTVSTIIGHLITRHVFFPESDWDDESEIEQTIQLIMYGLGGR
ncbi:TetR/AcrR family transcriptional regulator [Bacillus sp. 2205SS5-2]|uniref:TetR/AcrR family transcriptional regulator n=1 Tax=Bacillus sp. 2205SS5-2 TaxID=3109031 RepID=UPI003004AD58